MRCGGEARRSGTPGPRESEGGRWNGDKLPAQWGDEIRKWVKSATLDMSALRFITQQEDSSQPFEADIEILAVSGDRVDFHGLVFP